VSDYVNDHDGDCGGKAQTSFIGSKRGFVSPFLA